MGFFNRIINWFNELPKKIKYTYNEISRVVSGLEEVKKTKQDIKNFQDAYAPDRESFSYGRDSERSSSISSSSTKSEHAVYEQSMKNPMENPRSKPASLIKKALVSTVYYGRKGKNAVQNAISFKDKKGINSR